MHDLRRAELAAYIGISPTGLTNILNSHSEPTLRTAGKVAVAFGISLDELYGDLTRCVRAASVAFETAPVRSVRKGRVFDRGAQALNQSGNSADVERESSSRLCSPMTTRVRLLLTAALVCATALGLAAGSRMAGARRPDTAAHLADSIAGRLVHATPRQRRAIIREARTTAARDGVSAVIINAGGGVAGRTRVVSRPLIAATRGGPGDSRIAVRSWGGAARVGVLAGPAASGGGPPLWLLGGGAALLVALLLGAVGLPPLRRPAAPRVRRTPPGTPAAVEAAVARYDPLTGLPNRMLLRETAEAAIIRRRDAERVSLLLFDLDEFKEVNDNLGHFSGDSLLRALTARLEPQMPSGAMLARLGGDEFAVLAPVGLEGAGAIATAIGRLLERPFAIDGMMLQLDASIGVAVCPDHAPDFETLLKQADTAMYVGQAQPHRGRGARRRARAAAHLAPGTGRRPAAGHRGRRADAGVPAAGRAARRHLRRRGARSLGASRARPDPARPVHPARRAQRADPAADHVGARAGGRRSASGGWTRTASGCPSRSTSRLAT